MDIKKLVGSGDKIMKGTVPFLAAGIGANILLPELFGAASTETVRWAVTGILAAGILSWLWSAYLVLTQVPKNKLITKGPFSVVKHPLYTSVALLVLPATGVLLNSWLGLILGLVVYFMARKYAPEEERKLSQTFGGEWDKYLKEVKLKWL